MLSKKTTVEIQEEDDDDLPEDYAPIGAFAFWAVVPIMGWMISMTRWWYFGVSIPEINLELSPHGIRLLAFVMALILAGIGVFTTWWEPTVANFGINVAFPIVFVCVLFTAEKNFIITCIMVCFSILLPVILGIRKYLRWKDRKYLSAIRRRQEKMNIYVWIRKKVFCLLALGAVPWAFGNYFIGPDIPDKYIMYSEEIDFSQKLDKSKYPLLQNLDEMWNGYSAEEKLSAMQEMADYECGRLGVARIPVITEKKKTDTDTGFYDFEKDRIVLTEAGMKDETFFAVISEVINSCRYKYQQEFTECMRELEKKGKYAKKIPDFLETYKVAEAERKYEKGEISREEYTDVTYEDAARWRKDEAAYLKKEFGWK